MTDTNSLDSPNGTDTSIPLDPALAEGRSRLLLFVGMGAFALGTMLATTLVVYGGVALITAAFALNTAGKLGHYWALPIPTRDRTLLSVSWVLLAGTVVALLGTFAHTRYGSGQARFFWPLAIAGLGFGLLHMAAQGRYFPDDEDATGE